MSSAIVWLIMDVMSVQHVQNHIVINAALTISVQRMVWIIKADIRNPLRYLLMNAVASQSAFKLIIYFLLYLT